MIFMIKQITFLLILLTGNYLSAQTKEECVKLLRTVDRKQESIYWINTSLKGTVLIRETYDEFDRGQKPNPQEKETIDMSKVESVVVEYKESGYYSVNVYLEGEYYKRTNTYSESYTVKDNWFNYSGFKEKTEAIKVQEYIVKLSKYCGSKPLKY